MTMNKKTNLLHMLEGRPHEHIPVSFFQHFLPEDATGKRCVDAHVKFYKETDFDFIKIMHDGLTAPCSLTPDRIEDLAGYSPRRADSAYVQEYLSRAGMINDRINSEVYTYCNIFTPFTLLRRIGDEKLLDFIRKDKRFIRDVLCRMGEDIAWLSEKMIKDAGCLGVFLAIQGAETGLFTPEEYKEIIEPSDLIVTNAASDASPYNILHFCGWNGIKNQLALWQDYKGNTVNWAIYVEELPLPEGRKYFGMGNCMGGFDNRRDRLLYAGTREAVQAETTRILEQYLAAFGTSDHLMLGADCSFLPDFETRRFSWVTEALYTWEQKRGESI